MEISSKEAGGVKHNETTGLPGKSPREGKTKTYLDKPSLWLKRIILMEHENVFLFEYGLIVPAVLKCLFRHNLCRRLIFAPIKDFLDVYNVEQPGQT